jgi:ribosome-binding factor A
MSRRAFERNDRLEGEIRAVLADLLMFQVKDPRLESVSISGIKLSPDRSWADVFFSLFGDEERERQAGDGFKAATSFFRRELGRRMRLRVVPELKFKRDTSYEYGERMDRLFNRLHEDGVMEVAVSEAPDGGDTTATKDGIDDDNR